MSIYSPPETPPSQRRLKPLPKRQRTPPSASPPLAVQDFYLPMLTSMLEETRNEGGNAKKRKVPHAGAMVSGEVQGRVSRITAAGMQFKDSVRVRRRHLEGLVEEGEGEVVERALMLGLLGPGERDGKRRRLSKRLVLRAGRSAAKGYAKPLEDLQNFDFAFHVPSKATDSLRQLKHSVDLLRKRLAAAPKKRPPAPTTPAKQLGAPPPSVTSAKNNKKKKKRSALANASNPHHLRNYVPSRVPGLEQHTSNNNNNNGNNDFVPMRFLTAEIPPRKGGTAKRASTPAQGTNEWICAYCEYELFYGGDEEYRRAVRRRKKVLRRRRRARERAARGVAGKGHERKEPEEDREEGSDEDVDVFSDVTAAHRNLAGMKGDVAGRENGYG